MTLLLWRGSCKSLKYSRKTTASWIAPNSSAISSIAPLRKPNQEDHDRFSTSPQCHALLHPIALIDDAVDMDIRLVPVVGESFDHDAILLHALDEFVGPGADRLEAEPVARLLGGLGGQHHAGAIGELRDQRRERRLQHDPDGQRIDCLDAIDRRQ